MRIGAIPIIIFLFCAPLCATAQKAYSQWQKDSLNQIILKTPVLKISEYMNSLFIAMEKLPREEAQAWALSTIGFCKQHDQQTALAYAYLNAGRIDNSASAYQWFQDALQQAKETGSDRVLMEAHFRLATFQEQKFIKEEAYKNMLMAIGYARELKDTAAQRSCLIDFVSFHFRDGNYKRTIEIGKELLIMFQQEGMQTIEKRGELWMVMSLYNTFGMAYKALAMFDSAHVNYDRAAKMAYYIKDEFWIGLVAGNKGEAYVAEGCYEEGLPGLKKDIWISKKYKNWESASYSMVTVGRLYISIGDVTRASAYMDSAKSIHNKYIPEQPIPLQYWLLLADVEFDKGHYEKAWKAQKDYIRRCIEVVAQRESEKVAKVQSVFDLESKQREIDKLTHAGLIQQEQYKFQQTALIATVVGLALALLLVINFVKNYKKQKRATMLAAAQRDEIIKVNAQINEAYENLKIAQQQLIQTEKMALLGNLTSGVAHEVNTPLGVIKASADNIHISTNNIRTKLEALYTKVPQQCARLFFTLINQPSYWQKGITFREQRELKKQFKDQLKRESVRDAELLTEYLLNIGVTGALDPWMVLLKLPHATEVFSLANDVASLEIQRFNIGLAVGKASKILFALKAYSYQDQHPAITSIDVAENIDIVLSIYAYNLRQLTVVRNFEEVPEIRGYPEELNQVWTNLIHNALYAMGDGGTLSISIRKHLLEEILVEITDNGKGISPEHQEKLFVPFFTTKAQGEGTGLGLSIVKKIVDKHHARIEFESEPYKGTTFRIFFPIDQS